MTKCHTLGGLNNTFILHSTEGWEVQDQGGVSSFLVKVLFVACMVGREKALVSFPPLIRAPIPSWGGSTLRTSFKPNDGLKVPPPNTIPVGVRAAAYLCVCVCVWGCTNIQPIILSYVFNDRDEEQMDLMRRLIQVGGIICFKNWRKQRVYIGVCWMNKYSEGLRTWIGSGKDLDLYWRS